MTSQLAPAASVSGHPFARTVKSALVASASSRASTPPVFARVAVFVTALPKSSAAGDQVSIAA